VLDEIHAQGGLAIAAHPVGRFQDALQPEIARFDGAEVAHPIMFRDRGTPPQAGDGGGGWRWTEMRDFFLRAREAGIPLTAIGSSDYHGFSILGLCRTYVFTEIGDAPTRSASEEAILDALRRGRTVVFDREGRAYGDPALVAVLAREPLPAPDVAYDYRARDWLDALARTSGLFGAIGVVLFRARRS
jgi:hypothetical protein